MKLNSKLATVLIVVALAPPSVGVAEPEAKLSGTPEAAKRSAERQAARTKYRNEYAVCDHEAKKPQTVEHPARVTPYAVALKRCMELRTTKSASRA